ncbi:T9SS type A sorting domain-containing protein [bacterium SCSIO 12741]|nr:T9SS type A sorting domain-containing protein [bacterium SCSIO 12741]
MNKLTIIFTVLLFLDFTAGAQVLPKIVSVKTTKKADCVGVGATIEVTLTDTLSSFWTGLNVHLGTNTNNSERSGTSTYLGNKKYQITGVNVFPLQMLSAIVEANNGWGTYGGLSSSSCPSSQFCFPHEFYIESEVLYIGKGQMAGAAVPGKVTLELCRNGDSAKVLTNLPGKAPYYYGSLGFSGCSYLSIFPNTMLTAHRSLKISSIATSPNYKKLVDINTVGTITSTAIFDSTGCPIFTGYCDLSYSPYYNKTMVQQWIVETTGKPAIAVNDTLEYCSGDSILFKNKYYKTTTSVLDTTYSNQTICHDTLKTILIRPKQSSKKTIIKAKICDGDIYTFQNGDTSSINKNHVDINNNQCPTFWDTLETQLTVHPNYWDVRYDSLCYGFNYHFPHGFKAVNKPLIDTSYLTSSMGCDSVVVIHVKPIGQPLFKVDSICQGKTYTFQDGGTSKVPVIDTAIVSLPNGIYRWCSQRVVTQLKVTPPSYSSSYDTICSGATYNFISGRQSRVSVIDTSLLQTQGSCDLQVITHLTVSPPKPETIQSPNICQGQYYIFPNGDTTYVAKVDTSLLTTANGCDSTVVTTLSVLPTYYRSDKPIICSGNFYIFPNGDTSSINRNHLSYLTSIHGCDSIIETHLLVNPSYQIKDSVHICHNDSYTLPDGSIVSSDGTYTSSFSTQKGCDSIIETTLTVRTLQSSTVQDSICQGSVYTFPKGNTSQMATIDSAIFQNQYGCDSLIITHLNVISLDTSVTQNHFTLTVNDTTAQGYQWINCQRDSVILNAQNRQFEVTANGSYAVVLKKGACVDTSKCIVIENVGISSVSSQGNIRIYPNPTSGNLYLDWGVKAAETQVQILNSLGQVVWMDEYRDTQVILMELGQLPEGNYVLKAVGDQGTAEVFKLRINPPH